MPRMRCSVSVIVFVTTAVACGGDSTGPTSSPAGVLNQALAELTIPALTAGGGLSLVDIDTPALTSMDPTTCPYSAEFQRFVCAPSSANGITMKQSFILWSASGARQSAFDPATTATVSTIAAVNGTVVKPGTSLSVNGQQEVTLSGLASAPHVLDGYSSSQVAGTVTDETSTYPVNVRINTSIFNLVLPANEAGSSQVWPSSGTITGTIDGTFGPLSVNQSTSILFTGTSTVRISVRSGLATKNCTVDLAVAQPVC